MNVPAKLSPDDITRLMQDPTTEAKKAVAEKLTSHYAESGLEGFSNQETEMAEDIFRLLMAKAEVQVRALLALNLRQSPKLPQEIARQMANDVSEVAGPILEECAVLTDDDLISIINQADDVKKLEAIARRKVVSETVSDALVDTHIEKVVTTLVQNEGAAIGEKTYEKIVEHHAESATVMESMIERGSVPVAMVETIMERVSETLRKNLETKYGSIAEIKELRKALDKSMEMTSLKLYGLKTSEREIMNLMQRLGESGKLSPFMALCMGNLQLFEVSLSRILRVPLKNISALLKDDAGFKAAYDKAELPESMFPAVMLAVESVHDLEREALAKGALGKPVFSPFEVMERMRRLSAGRGEVEGTDYMYAMMQHHMRENVKQNTGG